MLPNASENQSAQAGKLASVKMLFGPNSRYALAAVHTRFPGVWWFVWDAERPDDDGYATLVRQFSTKEQAAVFVAEVGA